MINWNADDADWADWRGFMKRHLCSDNVASTRLLKVGWGVCYHNFAPTVLEGEIERG